jgi:hypothetical protein
VLKLLSEEGISIKGFDADRLAARDRGQVCELVWQGVSVFFNGQLAGLWNDHWPTLSVDKVGC